MQEEVILLDQVVFQGGWSFEYMKDTLIDKSSVDRNKNTEELSNTFPGNWNFISNGKSSKKLR